MTHCYPSSDDELTTFDERRARLSRADSARCRSVGMSSDSVIIIDAGGRTFKTSTTKLEASGAGYFEALLGETGRKLRGKKRARVSADGDDAQGGGLSLIHI